MNNKQQTVTLTKEDIAMAMSIIQTMRVVAINQNDKDEANLMHELSDCLLRHHCNDDDTVSINITREQCFSIWLSLDVYKDFCIEKMYTDELVKVKRIMRNLQPQV